MSYNGSGVFNINTAGQPVVTGTVISSTAFNALTADLATGLTTALTKDGQTTPTANIPMGGFKITGIAAATTLGDALSYGRAATVSTLTNSALTSGRVPYASTAGLLVDSANLTFNGTTLTANTIGAFTLSGTIAGGGNQINNVIIGTSTPLAGSFTSITGTSITDSGLTSGRVPYATTAGLLTDSANLLYSGTDLTVYGLTVGRGAGAVSDNTAMGVSALAANTSGARNTAYGNVALQANITGTDNTGIGRYALNGSTSSSNTAVGSAALYQATSGGQNTAVGQAAGANITTGGSNTFIGNSSSGSANNVTNEIVVCSGSGGTGKGGSTGFINPNGGGVYQGNNGATWSVTSDQRLKKNIVDNNIGLDKILSIQVRNFEYRLPEEVDAELKPTDAIKKSGVQLGAIAQELQQILPDCVKTESTGVMSVQSDNLTWYLINAIKELNLKITALESK